MRLSHPASIATASSCDCTAPVAPPTIAVQGLGIRYGDRPALTDTSFVAPAGQVTALVGPSGCGKSSALRCCNRLNDLIPTARVSGHVRIGGRDIGDAGIDLRQLRRQIGSIDQTPNPFPSSIRSNFDIPLREHRCGDKRSRTAIAEQALRDVGLWHEVQGRLSASASTLSGGQQQRLCIARALALSPMALLMDEPCSALDPMATQSIEDLIQRLRGRLTILIVTHNLAQARRLADHVAVFWVRDGVGTCIEEGPAKQVLDQGREAETRRYLSGATG